MTNEEAKAFLDNLKICINEHSIVADWLVEIANRKTEPQKIGYCNECNWFRDKQVCGRCRSKNLYAPKHEPQTMYYPQVDGITPSVIAKDEPQTYVINPQEPTNDDKCFECDDFFTCGGQCNKIEDEPQTCEECEHWSDTEDGCADRHGCMIDCAWK